VVARGRRACSRSRRPAPTGNSTALAPQQAEPEQAGEHDQRDRDNGLRSPEVVEVPAERDVRVGPWRDPDGGRRSEHGRSQAREARGVISDGEGPHRDGSHQEYGGEPALLDQLLPAAHAWTDDLVVRTAAGTAADREGQQRGQRGADDRDRGPEQGAEQQPAGGGDERSRKERSREPGRDEAEHDRSGDAEPVGEAADFGRRPRDGECHDDRGGGNAGREERQAQSRAHGAGAPQTAAPA